MARKTPPLSPNLPMVDPATGVPTPFFMRWWQEQVQTNAAIQTLSTAAEVSALFDILGTAARGDVIYRGATLWELLPAGVSGEFLQTQGPGADVLWASPNATFLSLTDTPGSFVGEQGQLTRVNAGETALEFVTLSTILDSEIGTTRGSIIFRGASDWTVLGPDTSSAPGYLRSQGSTADPIWDTPTAATFLSLLDTPGSFVGEQGQLTRVNSGETALEFATLSDILDSEIGTTRGSIIFRGASAWVVLGPDTSSAPGYLRSQGASADPIWDTPAGGGPSSTAYDMRFGFRATPTASQVLDTVMIVRDIIIPANMAGSLGLVEIDPAASFVMDLKDDGVTIGTVTVSTLGAFTFATTSGTAKSVATGSVLTLEAPATPDTTVENMALTILADEDL